MNSLFLEKVAEKYRNGGLREVAHHTVRILRELGSAPGLLMEINNLSSSTSIEDLVEFAFNAQSGLIRPLQIKEEIIALLKDVRDLKPKCMMEIGTAKGGTLFLFSRVADPEALLISVDMRSLVFGGGYPVWKRKMYKRFSRGIQKIELIQANSHDKSTFAQVQKILDGRSLDFLFIDGDHSYEGVKTDYNLYSPLVRKGGLIALHDVAKHLESSKCDVDLFWKEMAASSVEHREMIADAKQGWAGIGWVRK